MASLQHNQDPLSLGIIGLMEVILLSPWLCWSHSRPERKEIVSEMYFGFSVISFGLFLLTWPAVRDYSLKRFCTPSTF
jgi:hypothetical protein